MICLLSEYLNTCSISLQENRFEVAPNKTCFILGDLESRVEYWVRVSASTHMGEGESTQIVTVMPVNKGTFDECGTEACLYISW